MIVLAVIAGITLPGLAAHPAAAQIGQPYAKVSGDRAVVYAGPGTGFWQFGALRKNVITPVTGVTADRQFWYSETPIGAGYLRAQDVEVVGGESVPIIDPGIIGTIITGAANVRTGPGAEAPSIATLQKDMQFFVIGQQPDGSWLQIRFKGGKGWVKATLTNLGTVGVPDAPSTAGPIAIANANVTLRSGPGTQYTIIGVIPAGEVSVILGKNASGRWLFVDSILGEGWVITSGVATRNYFGSVAILDAESTGAELDLTAKTRTGANIRLGPGLGFESIGSVAGGTFITILGQSADKGWWYADTPVGTGWIAKSVVATPRDFSRVVPVLP